MGYKVLGFAVWKGLKWYLRRRVEGARVKIAVAGLAGLVLAGAVTALRARSSD